MNRPIKVAFVVVDDRSNRRTPDPKFGPAPSAVLTGLAMFPEDVEVDVISCTQQDHIETHQLSDNIRFHGLPVPKIGYLRSLHAGCILAVQRKISEIRPDVVHAQGSERWCAVSTAWLPFPKILTIHGNLEALDPVFRPKPRLYWKLQTLLQKITAPRFDGIFCNSDYTQSAMSKTAAKTWRVDNPIRSEFITAQASTAATPSLPTLLCVGMFAPWKRQREILGVAKTLHQRGIKVKFRFIGGLGEDQYGKICRELLAEGESMGFAEYAGTMSPDSLVVEMDRAHGMVHFPSEEAFGLVVAEGLARGLAFFGCKVGGLNDITAGVPSCELSERDDFEGLASALTAWIHTGAPRNPAARNLMVARYSPRVIAQRHIDIYRELLATGKNNS